jgi:hypothetical protein
VRTNAYTDVDGSEQNSELAFAVNGEGTRNVAVAQERNCRSRANWFEAAATFRVSGIAYLVKTGTAIRVALNLRNGKDS